MLLEKLKRANKLRKEMVDVFDKNNNPIESRASMINVHLLEKWHRATHIWVYNKRGELLLQHRAKQMATYPNRWDLSAAGHLDAREEPLAGAQRELKEEINLAVKEDELEFLKVKKIAQKLKFLGIPRKNKEFCYVYLLKSNEGKNLEIQESELKEIKFFDTDKLKKELKNNPAKFVPHGDYWFEIIKEVKKRTS